MTGDIISLAWLYSITAFLFDDLTIKYKHSVLSLLIIPTHSVVSLSKPYLLVVADAKFH